MTTHHQFPYTPDDKLEEALALLAAGLPLDEVLAEAGEDAVWLRPLLETTVDIGRVKEAIPLPPPEASLARMLAHAETLRREAAPDDEAQPGRWHTLSTLLLTRPLVGLATALLLLVLGGGTLMILSQDSLPGQPLYGLKQGSEALQLGLTFNETERERLVDRFNQRRQAETRQLLKQGQTAAVSFAGRVETVTEDMIIVDGLAAQVRPETRVDGSLNAGAYVHFAGTTDPNGNLMATSITVTIPAPPTVTPSPSPTTPFTATPSPTHTPEPTATFTPRPTATPPATPTASPSPTLAPTATLTPIPTFVTDDGVNVDDFNDNEDGFEDDGEIPNDETGEDGANGDNGADNFDDGSNDNSGDDSGGGGNDNTGGDDSGDSGDGGNDNTGDDDNSGDSGDNGNDNTGDDSGGGDGSGDSGDNGNDNSGDDSGGDDGSNDNSNSGPGNGNDNDNDNSGSDDNGYEDSNSNDGGDDGGGYDD